MFSPGTCARAELVNNGERGEKERGATVVRRGALAPPTTGFGHYVTTTCAKNRSKITFFGWVQFPGIFKKTVFPDYKVLDFSVKFGRTEVAL